MVPLNKTIWSFYSLPGLPGILDRNRLGVGSHAGNVFTNGFEPLDTSCRRLNFVHSNGDKSFYPEGFDTLARLSAIPAPGLLSLMVVYSPLILDRAVIAAAALFFTSHECSSVDDAIQGFVRGLKRWATLFECSLALDWIRVRHFYHSFVHPAREFRILVARACGLSPILQCDNYLRVGSEELFVHNIFPQSSHSVILHYNKDQTHFSVVPHSRVGALRLLPILQVLWYLAATNDSASVTRLMCTNSHIYRAAMVMFDVSYLHDFRFARCFTSELETSYPPLNRFLQIGSRVQDRLAYLDPLREVVTAVEPCSTPAHWISRAQRCFTRAVGNEEVGDVVDSMCFFN